MIKKLFTDLHADKNILYLDKGSDGAIFHCNEMGILSIDLNNINLHNDFDGDDRDTIILIRLLARHTKFRKRKELKKELSEELITATWHPDSWWDWCMSEYKEKEKDTMFVEELYKCVSVVYKLGVLKHFVF